MHNNYRHGDYEAHDTLCYKRFSSVTSFSCFLEPLNCTWINLDHHLECNLHLHFTVSQHYWSPYCAQMRCRGIDYGLANNEVPAHTSKLPPVLRKVIQLIDDSVFLLCFLFKTLLLAHFLEVCFHTSTAFWGLYNLLIGV